MPPSVRPPTDIGGITCKTRKRVDVGAGALCLRGAASCRVEVNHVVTPRGMRLEDARLGRRGHPKGRGLSDVVLLDPKGNGHLIVRGSGVDKGGAGDTHIATCRGQVEGVVIGSTSAPSTLRAIARSAHEGAFVRFNLVFRYRLGLDGSVGR